MVEAILFIVAIGGLWFTLWMVGWQQQAQQLKILESIHLQLLLRNADHAETVPLARIQGTPHAAERPPTKSV